MKAFCKQTRILATLILVLFGAQIFAHSVQVAYCIGCDGKLRLYVEHWHGTEDPNSTTMTIEYTVGGVTTSIVGSPVGSIQNIPFGQLPGCATPATSFGTCPGSANTYNDWVYYDFLNPPNGVPITIKVISGSNAFTMDCGGMYPAVATFTIPPISNVAEVVPNQTVCKNSPFGAITYTNGGVTNWSNNNTSIGLGATGTGNIPSFTAVNNSSTVQTAIISFTYGCNTGTFQLSVNPPPSPLFNFPLSSSGDNNNYCKANAINFSLTSSSGVTANWNFGDGVTSALLNPSHTYSSPGNYSVSVVVTGANSCTSTSTQTLSIYTPTANFTTINNCLSVTSTFSNSSSSPQTIAVYAWNYGNNIGTGTGSTPTYVYPSSGTFSVMLSITAVDGCTASISKPITIYPNPSVTFTAPAICLGFPTNFINNSTVAPPDNVNSWAWDFQNDATIDNTMANPSYTYPTSGIFNVALTATSNNGCITTSVIAISVNEKPTVSFNPTSVCEGVTVAMNNTSSIPSPNSIALYTWDFGSGASSTTSSNQNPTNVSYATYGIKTITLSLLANTGCTATASQTVMINPNPIANFTFANKCINQQPNTFDATSSTVALGNNTTYAWLFGNGNSDPNNVSASHNYATAGIYNVTLTVTSDKACKGSIAKLVEVYQKPLLSISSTSVCFKVAMSFSATSLPNSGLCNSWAWDFDNNTTTIEGIGKATNFNFTSEGTHTISVTAATDNNCIETYTKTVYVNYLPKPDFVVDDPEGCAEHCVVFSNQTPALTTPETNVKWKWILGDGTTINSSNANNKSHCYGNATSDQLKTYDVKLIVTTSVGCKDSISKASFITVFPNPIAKIDFVPDFGNVAQPQIDYLNKSIDYTFWTWNFGDGTKEDSTKVNPSHYYNTLDAKSYFARLIVRNQYGCIDTAYTKIDIAPEFIFYIPNAFTPLNDDGINDVFIGQGIGIAKYEMWIHDRWGASVFYTDDIKKGWNGKVQGQETISKQEVYVWRVKLKDVFGKEHEYVGHVTLLK